MATVLDMPAVLTKIGGASNATYWVKNGRFSFPFRTFWIGYGAHCEWCNWVYQRCRSATSSTSESKPGFTVSPSSGVVQTDGVVATKSQPPSVQDCAGGVCSGNLQIYRRQCGTARYSASACVL
ncbi:hypothetical protein FA13DRAFT_1812418 [Coprinellus micaceus]|uniref:Uncharacterized protein n=1 Tax=Coprinellus micaceus TaxID=71717 RepID=A0A4Y7TI35_COPMI|nr:hypothetical protein FA13DRAFT_1812418 [Coprinellus micaceus]